MRSTLAITFTKICRSAAFTLNELLIVMAIISLLASLSIMAISRVRRQANLLICTNNLKQAGAGVLMYANEYKGYLPYEGYAEGDRQIRHLGWFEDPAFWANAIPKALGLPMYYELQNKDIAGVMALPKVGDRHLFICPNAIPASAAPVEDLIEDECFKLWGTEDEARTVFSRRKTYWCYGYNTQLDNGVEERNVGHKVWVKITQVPQPAVTAFLVEKIMNPLELKPAFSTAVGQQEVSYKEFTTRHQINRAGMDATLPAYKNQGGNILMVDGHVEYFSRGEVIYAPKAPMSYDQPGKLMWSAR